MRANFHIGVTGGTGLLGKELGNALRDAAVGETPRLLKAEGTAEKDEASAARELVEYGDEPAVVEALTRESLAGLDTLFLAGGSDESRRAWELAQGARIRVIDVSGTLADEPGAVLAGWDGAPAARLVVVAHPAAQALVRLLSALETAGPVEAATAVVFEPASQRGWAGIQELEQQSVKLLSLQSQPREVFDAQVAFNLRIGLGEEARPSLSEVRERIALQIARLRGAKAAGVGAGAVRPAVELIQAPLFHATAISLHVQYRQDPGNEAVGAALAGIGVELAAPGDDPDAVAAAGQDAMQVSAPRADGSGPGYWLFVTLDNLRRSVLSAVASATAGLEP